MDVDFHYDAGHGWLKVRAQQLIKVGLNPLYFSPYSYAHVDERGNRWVYLEEDFDAGLFSLAAAAAGIKLRVTKVDDGDWSPIRNMGRLPGDRFKEGEALMLKMMKEMKHA